ncbi:ras GEF [Auriculariales sp. MPI-PUGE-AT-0066]|nr:ras GEF [Auriculariales sp. MPI-PUGE-AT-0066]
MDTTHDLPAPEFGLGGGADAGSDATRLATTDVQTEIARAELFIAADGSYVETTSAHAARELKRRYDTLLGVGKGRFQRSPYAITAVMVHGRTMFRISRKEDDADVLPDTARRTSTATLQSPSGTTSPPVGPGAAKHRKSRLSVSALLPSRGRDKERDRVSSYGNSTQHGHDDEGPRKLRKVRSGGEIAQHQQQQGHQDPYNYYASHGAPSESELTGGGGNREGAFPYLHVSVGSLDPFADVVGLADSLNSGPSYFDPSASFVASSYGDTPSTHVSGGDGEIAPFGPGVRFIPPMNPALAKTKRINQGDAVEGRGRPIRVMASFESGRTARRASISPPSPIRDSGSSLASLIPLATGTHIPPNSSSVIFDVLQSYSGLPRPSRLSAKSALETVRMSAAEASDPKDDPRFVLYDDEPHKIMLAATIERWVASLTSSLDYDALLDFFLTYRSYITAGSLLGIFKERFAWTLDQPNSAARRLVRVRTFLAIRYWMVTFFGVDFLRDEPLRRDVAAWVNGLALDYKVRNAPDAMSIVRKLKKLIMECKSLYSVPNITSPPTPPPARPTSTLGDLSNAASFAASIQKAAEMSLSLSRPTTTIESSDVDLDLGPLDALEWTPAHIGGFASAPQAAMSHLLLSGALLGPHGAAGAATSPNPAGPSSQPVAGMERRSSGVSRALVNTLGKIGRWKRAFSTTTTSTPNAAPPRLIGETKRQPHAHVQSYGREREVLVVNGGVSEYLRLLGGESAPVPPPPDVKEAHREEVVGWDDAPRASEVFEVGEVSAREAELDQDVTIKPRLTDAPMTGEEAPMHEPEAQSTDFDRRAPRESFASESSYGSVLPPGLSTARQLFVGNAETSRPPGSDADAADEPVLPPGLGGIQFTHPDPFAAANNKSDSPTTPAASAAVSDPLASARPVTPPTYGDVEGPTTPNARTPQQPQVTASRDAVRNSVASISSLASESSYGEEFVSRRLLPPGLSFSTAYAPAGASSGFNAHGTYNMSGARLPDLVHDDVELSDSDADSITGAPGQRLDHPVARRLPRRRDFDLVRHSASVSSMHTRSSRATSEDLSAARNSQDEAGYVIGGPVQQWQLDMINEHISDDEDGGDAEFALRRLEGRIDADRQRAKLRKVDGWLAAIQKRMVEGSPDSDGDEDEEQARKQRRSEEEEERDDAEEARRAGEMLVVEGLPDESLIGATTPTGFPTGVSPLIPTSDTATTLTEPPIASFSSSPQPDLPAVALTPITPIPTQIPQQEPSSRRPSISRPPGQSMTVHQSFVLLHKSEAIAHHLATVDRELFIAVRFEEIVSHDWEHPGQGLDMPGENDEQVNPTDWAGFMRSRRALGRRASDVLAVKARFNIIVAWVASEISLSHSNQRAAVAGKFIRIAWKSYLLNNYAAVVGIMAGLQCQWTHRAMGKAWSKVGTWELRVFDDLRAFTSREGNFRFVREATREASVEHKYCVPFIGIYLAQLHDLSHLPDFVDPTSPTSPVTLVSLTPSTLSPSAPRLPEIFANLAPLPPSVALEPLVNIHKQRRIAGVIKALVAGQHLADAERPPAPEVEPSKASADRRLLQRCVRLKALDDHGFSRALNVPS